MNRRSSANPAALFNKPRRITGSAVPSSVAALGLAGLLACGGAGTASPAAPAQVGPAVTAAGAAPAAAATDLDAALIALNAATDLDGAVVGAAQPTDRATLVVVFASWCSNCRNELAMLGGFRLEHPELRIIGLNAYEDYADRGNEAVMRAYVGENAPWMRVVRSTPALLAAFGTPTKVPSVFVYDRQGHLVEAFDRAKRPPPNRDQLAAVFATLPE